MARTTSFNVDFHSITLVKGRREGQTVNYQTNPSRQELVGTGRFELPTCRLGGGRSIHLSYVPVSFSSLPAAQTFMSDVGPVVHPGKMDLLDGSISRFDRCRERRALCCYTQNTTSADD